MVKLQVGVGKQSFPLFPPPSLLYLQFQNHSSRQELSVPHFLIWCDIIAESVCSQNSSCQRNLQVRKHGYDMNLNEPMSTVHWWVFLLSKQYQTEIFCGNIYRLLSKLCLSQLLQKGFPGGRHNTVALLIWCGLQLQIIGPLDETLHFFLALLQKPNTTVERESSCKLEVNVTGRGLACFYILSPCILSSPSLLYLENERIQKHHSRKRRKQFQSDSGEVEPTPSSLAFNLVCVPSLLMWLFGTIAHMHVLHSRRNYLSMTKKGKQKLESHVPTGATRASLICFHSCFSNMSKFLILATVCPWLILL